MQDEVIRFAVPCRRPGIRFDVTGLSWDGSPGSRGIGGVLTAVEDMAPRLVRPWRSSVGHAGGEPVRTPTASSRRSVPHACSPWSAVGENIVDLL
ncbi:hypothetical protein HNR68_002327 [Saccharopolyspora hordei]|uniref:Uncharacterized protein n=1 Tax=Saccharopolyspora hordei TaxID=1838 RepID=A0A853ARE7_9PSEU|nr:hypothetical protein [Saccharopolyspora hordei]